MTKPKRPLFQRRHYNIIASAANAHANSGYSVNFAIFLQDLADIFEKDNPAFDRNKFIEAAWA